METPEPRSPAAGGVKAGEVEAAPVAHVAISRHDHQEWERMLWPCSQEDRAMTVCCHLPKAPNFHLGQVETEDLPCAPAAPGDLEAEDKW
jgi:hypothetical protein